MASDGKVSKQDITEALEAGRITAHEFTVLNSRGAADLKTKARQVEILAKIRKWRASQERKRLSGSDRAAEFLARRAEIGTIPEVANPERREACRLDLARFLSEYMPEVFFRDFDADAFATMIIMQ